MNPLKKFWKFFINRLGQKTAEIPKAEIPKAEIPKAEIPKAEIPKAEIPKAKTPKKSKPFNNKYNQSLSNDDKCVKCGHDGDIHNEYSECLEEGCDCSLSTDDNGVVLVSKEKLYYEGRLEPGWVLDTCTLKNYEDFPTVGHVLNSLPNGPIYVTSLVGDEFHDKECTKLGRLRNFDEALAGLAKSLDRKIYYVEIGTRANITSWYIGILSKYCLSKLKRFGLHYPDNIHVAFAKFTNSTMITSDKIMIRCLKQEQMHHIEFQDMTEKIMQPSPITIYHRERRNYLKNKKYRGRKG